MRRVKLRYVGEGKGIIDARGMIREIEKSTDTMDMFSLNRDARLCIRYNQNMIPTGEVVLVAKRKKDMGNLLNRCYQSRFDDWQAVRAA